MKTSRPTWRQILGFAAVFVAVHFLIMVFFDSMRGSGGKVSLPGQLLRSILTAALAAPIYFVLLGRYGNLRARRGEAERRAGQCKKKC